MLVLLLFSLSVANPYFPSSGWTYYLEAARVGAWPECAYRFLSYPGTCAPDVNLWNGAGINEGRLKKWNGCYFSFPCVAISHLQSGHLSQPVTTLLFTCELVAEAIDSISLTLLPATWLLCFWVLFRGVVVLLTMERPVNKSFDFMAQMVHNQERMYSFYFNVMIILCGTF
jgi:hypothetical protein